LFRHPMAGDRRDPVDQRAPDDQDDLQRVASG
jgi:hypothetical protein